MIHVELWSATKRLAKEEHADPKDANTAIDKILDAVIRGQRGTGVFSINAYRATSAGLFDGRYLDLDNIRVPSQGRVAQPER